jgi:hypothetical protein
LRQLPNRFLVNPQIERRQLVIKGESYTELIFCLVR